MGDEQKSRTLFVRNLPYTCTNASLENVFSDIGPVKRCFVVKDLDSDNACKGYGYVTFSLVEDAKTAKEKIKLVDGRNVHIHFSQPRVGKKSKKGKNESDDTKEEANPEADKTGKTACDMKGPNYAREKQRSVAKQKYTAACTVVLSKLPQNVTTTDIENLATKTKGVETVVYSDGKAFVRYSSKTEAVEAVKKLGKTKVKGQPVAVMRQSQEMILMSPKYLQRCKLIVRNLAFQCSEEELKETFGKFGEVVDVAIPKTSSGKKRGFGFVQFSRLEDASTALKEMNTKAIKGRPVAIDWSVPKAKYQKLTESNTTSSNTPEKDQGEEGDEGSSNEEKEQDDVDTEESGDEEIADRDESEAEDSDEQSEEEESEDESDSDKASEGEDSGSEGAGSSDEGFSEERSPQKKNTKPRREDVEEGKTLFIRNLPFDAEEEDVEEQLEQFGELVYSKVVVDPNTEASRGSAFVKFKNKDDAEKCLAAANEDGARGIVMDGRKLNVVVAVPRQKASELKQKKDVKDTKDKRNLWLIREGMIRPGTRAAQGLSEADIAKRAKVEEIKRQKLKNANIFVSTTRLCVRNLPTNVDDKKLKRVFLKAAGDKSAVVTESRIMRDMGRVNSQGVGKSRGYGFVNFREHEHALQALRAANNNPDIFGDNKRLIVEFSLENKSALLAQEKRLERNKARKEMFSRADSNKRGTTSEETGRNEKGSGWRGKKRMKGVKPTDIVKPVPVQDEAEAQQRRKIPRKLPSHWGVKVRHKDRKAPQSAKGRDGKQQDAQRGNEKKRKAEHDLSMVPEKKRRKSRGRREKEQTDEFDKLVNKYRRNLSTAVKEAQTKKSRIGNTSVRSDYGFLMGIAAILALCL